MQCTQSIMYCNVCNIVKNPTRCRHCSTVKGNAFAVALTAKIYWRKEKRYRCKVTDLNLYACLIRQVNNHVNMKTLGCSVQYIYYLPTNTMITTQKGLNPFRSTKNKRQFLNSFNCFNIPCLCKSAISNCLLASHKHNDHCAHKSKQENSQLSNSFKK